MAVLASAVPACAVDSTKIPSFVAVSDQLRHDGIEGRWGLGLGGATRIPALRVTKLWAIRLPVPPSKEMPTPQPTSPSSGQPGASVMWFRG